MAAGLELNRDRVCPKCGSAEVKNIGAPGKVVFNGEMMSVPVRYHAVVECGRCREVRGK
jgi:predicted nucleic-acid-binding Zn-ribbon protein